MRRVGIITPIKNEAETLPALVESMKDQSHRPVRWVIIDDGSTDGSSAIIEDAASNTDWIEGISKTDSPEYDIGVNYARVLSTGYTELNERLGEELDYYAVVDGDMRLSEGYLAAVMSYLDAHDDIVVACASIYTRTESGLNVEKQDRMHPLGGATLYDGDFYRSIGGPPLTPCVDSVTKAKARIRGYQPRYATELDEQAIQSRPTHRNGDSRENFDILGRNNYAIGYPPVPAVARGFYLMDQSTIPMGAYYLWGYFSSWIRDESRLTSDEVVAYYYRQKRRSLAETIREKARKILAG